MLVGDDLAPIWNQDINDHCNNIAMLASVRNRFEKQDRFSVYSFDQLIGSDRMIETCGKIIIFHIVYNINI